MADKETVAKQEAPPDLALLLLPKEKWRWPVIRFVLYMTVVATPWFLLRWNSGVVHNSGPFLLLSGLYYFLEYYIRLHRERVRRLLRKAAGIYEEPAARYRGPQLIWPLAVALPCLWSWWVAGELGDVDVFIQLAAVGWLLCWAVAILVARVVSGRAAIGADQAWLILVCVVVAQVVAVTLDKAVAQKMESSIFYAVLDLKMMGLWVK